MEVFSHCEVYCVVNSDLTEDFTSITVCNQVFSVVSSENWFKGAESILLAVGPGPSRTLWQ